MIALPAIWRIVKPILTFGVTLPVWAFLLIGGWLYLDKASTLRKATANLVAGAQMDALNAQLVEERRLRIWAEGKAEESRRIADLERAARADLAIQLVLTDEERKGLADDITAIQTRAYLGDCTVDRDLLERLRNK